MPVVKIYDKLVKFMSCTPSLRSKEVDYLCFFVETIMDDIMEHLRQYKRAGQLCEDECEDGSWAELSPTAKARQIERAFFEKEPSDNPWRAVCLSQPARLGTRSLYHN